MRVRSKELHVGTLGRFPPDGPGIGWPLSPSRRAPPRSVCPVRAWAVELRVAAGKAFGNSIAIEEVSAIVADCCHEFLEIGCLGRDDIAELAATWTAQRLVDHR